jgi:radical SAM superfamily enzyme YgiQ (UPF0313 family)
LFVTKDTAQYTNWFPQGIAYLASVLLKEGYGVEIYNQDLHHYSDEHLTHYLDNNNYDVIGVGAIGGYYQYKRLIRISNAINNSRNKPFYIIGGHCPSPDPEYFLKKTKADVAILGEGEVTIVELLDALSDNKALANIKGIAFKDNEKIIINEDRPLIQDIDNIPLPAYHLFPIEQYRMIRMPNVKKDEFVMPILSGRGCIFKCTFCYRMDKEFRARSVEAIIEEIMLLKREYGINYFIFSDELLMSSVKRTINICEEFIKAGLNIKWNCSGRLNFAKREVLNIMKRAGCVFINYGVESVDNNVLKNMRKALNVEQIIKGIEATLIAGISPGLNMIFGNIGDNKETLNKAVEFLLKYDDCAELRTIKPVTPYPGSPLYYTAIDKGFIKDCEDFYENKHTNSDLITTNFTELNDDEFHRCLFDANKKILTNYYNRQLSTSVEQARRLYIDKDTSFRGFRQR